jgi:DNA gyrase/topoisomerase IV subunit B
MHGLLQGKKLISVWNNGAGVPVEVHKEENVYVPELIFGHLLTSSNYNDTEKKVRKLACSSNICST